MNLKCFLLFIILCIYNTPLQAARILSVFGFPGQTQYAFIEPLLKELASRGHQITSITNFPQQKPVENFRDIVIKENINLFDDFQHFSIDDIEANYYDIVEDIYNVSFQMCLNILNDPTVRHTFATEKFDLIILEVFFSESFFGLAEYLKAPIIGVSTLSTMTSIDELVGNISPISFIPNMILPMREMNFWYRLLNVLVHSLEWVYYYNKYMPVQKQIYEKYFPTAQIRFEEAQKNFALVLVNDHFSLSAPRPYVPNMIEVAGLHINTNSKLLSTFEKEILDNAKDGVIFVSIDSIIPLEKVKIFLKQFKILNKTVLWKTSQAIVNPPSNVFINSNFAQASILAHPNVKLFITQATFLNIVESVYHALPILGLAHTGNTDDYFDYIKKVGNGRTLKLQNISDKSLSKALNELLYSTFYTEYSKLLSKRFRDQQTSPMDRAVYWVEYVLRHNGAAHLRNMGQNLNWYQFYNFDIILLLVIIISLLICLAYIVIKIAMKFFWKLKLRKIK